MVKSKAARVYTLDELKEKCQKALTDPKLVEIVKTAPLNKEGKVNLSWVYKEAEKYVHGETKDLQKTKELAVATRFLAMLRRDHQEEFEKLVSTQKQLGETTVDKKKNFWEIEFEIPSCVELITKEHCDGGEKVFKKRAMRFLKVGASPKLEEKFCMEILNALIETTNSPRDMDLMNDLIQLLEEKFGIQIKICLTCGYYQKENNGCTTGTHMFVPTYNNETGKFYGCKGGWTPVEVPKKKEN